MEAAPAPVAQPVRILAEPAFFVLVVPDAPDGLLGEYDRQLLGAAQILAGQTGAVVLLAALEMADIAGADRVLPCAEVAGYDPTGRALTVMAALATLDPRHVLFAESADGGDLARRVAAMAGMPLFTNVEALNPDFVIRACGAGRFEQRAAPGRLLTLAPDRVPGYSGPPCEARALPSLPPVNGDAMPAKRLLADPESLPLTEANFVVAAGSGVTDFDLFAKLVRALRATPGASRVLCDAGLMPRTRQVGASGSVLQAECYLALGISGAPQHLAGVAGVRHVVAVNTDLHAAMVDRASLAVIADAQEVMRALVAML
jgi:electron transfer flavoprotein alpha subunit